VALWVTILLAPLIVCGSESDRARNLQQHSTKSLGRLSVGQKIRTASGALNTIEAIIDSTHAARAVKLQTSNAKSKNGDSRTVSARHKSKDGGSTSVIANRNFMSITEDQDGNPLPPPLSEAEKNLAEAEETIKKAQAKHMATFNEKSQMLHSPSSSPPTWNPGSGSKPKSSASGSAAKPTSSASYGSPSASQPRFRAKLVATTQSRAVKGAIRRQQQTHTRQTAQRVTGQVHQTAKTAQQLVETATRENALAEVKEALEAATKTNERNAKHDEMKTKEHSAKRLG